MIRLVIVFGTLVGLVAVGLWAARRVVQSAEGAVREVPGDWCMRRIATEGEYRAWQRRSGAQ